MSFIDSVLQQVAKVFPAKFDSASGAIQLLKDTGSHNMICDPLRNGLKAALHTVTTKASMLFRKGEIFQKYSFSSCPTPGPTKRLIRYIENT